MPLEILSVGLKEVRMPRTTHERGDKCGSRDVLLQLTQGSQLNWLLLNHWLLFTEAGSPEERSGLCFNLRRSFRLPDL